MVTTSHQPGAVDEADPDGPVGRPRSFSLRGPALVLGIAVFIVLGGVVASALASGNAPTTSLSSVTIGGGTVVPLVPAQTAMKSIVTASEPPGDIIGNLEVPTPTTVTGHVNADQGQGQFDRTVSFTSSALAPDQVTEVYRTLLPKQGWRILYSGPGTGRFGGHGTEVLAKLGSGDGFYWEAGVVVSPMTPAGVTPFSVELFELNDDN